jgi:hypothetical protein
MGVREELLEKAERLAVIAHETGAAEDLQAWREAEEALTHLDQDFRLP